MKKVINLFFSFLLWSLLGIGLPLSAADATAARDYTKAMGIIVENHWVIQKIMWI